MLIDFSNNSNDLGGGGMPQPPGFLGYPQPPPLPHLVNPLPGAFAYPVSFCWYYFLYQSLYNVYSIFIIMFISPVFMK